MKIPKYQVYNETDGILASHARMSLEQAQLFVKEFPEKFQSQGYYQTADGTSIDPKEVKLYLIRLDLKEKR